MKKALTVLTFLIATLFLVSCIEVEDQLQGIDLDWTPEDTYSLDQIVNLSEIGVNIVATFQTQTLTISIGDEEVTVFGSGVIVDEDDNILLKTSEIGSFSVSFVYQGETLTINYDVVVSLDVVEEQVEVIEAWADLFATEYPDDVTFDTLFNSVRAYEHALSMVALLEPGTAKSELEARLNVVKVFFDTVTELDMSDQAIPSNDMGKFAVFANLEVLNLSNVGIINFWAFPSLSKLHTLIASDNTVPDLNLLPVLPSLTHLDVSNNDIIDLNGMRSGTIAKFPNLEVLNVSFNLITDFEGMRSQTKLHTLIAQSANRSGTGNFDAFSTYENLRTTIRVLDASNNGLVNVEFLDAQGQERVFENLVELDISNNNIINLHGLFYAPNLETLDASNNAFEADAFIDLVWTTQLNYLDISFTEVELPELPYDIETLINEA